VDLLAEFFASLFGDFLFPEWAGRRAGKRQQAGEVDCGLRVIAGSQQGLNRDWDHDRAFVYPGRLDFGGDTSVWIPVRAVVTDRQRQLARRKGWRSLRRQVVELTTDSATLEWAVPEDELDWVMERVRGSDESA
jgi:hypothetical protein